MPFAKFLDKQKIVLEIQYDFLFSVLKDLQINQQSSTLIQNKEFYSPPLKINLRNGNA
ncbi:MAG: hypothetical protein IJA69_05175 [Clostridia bacterium]|nr:hypothetical protein [Clostridia bacterium]